MWKKTTQKVSCAEIARCMCVAPNTVFSLRNRGVDLQELYSIFNSSEKTRREKKNYLYDIQGISEKNKDHLWESYCGF